MGPAIIGFLQTSSRHNQPRQIAWAIVWGCICGMLPKSSLLFYIASAASLLMPMHLAVAAMTLLISSIVSPAIQPIFGNLGHWILNSTGLVGPIRSLDRFPLVPWLKLHNTVLLGASTICSAAALPSYWIITSLLTSLYRKWFPLYEAQQIQMQANVSDNRPLIVHLAAEPMQTAANVGSVQPMLASQLNSSTASSPRPPMVAPEVEPQPLAAALDRFDETMSSFTATQRRGSSQQVASSLSDVIDSIHALEDLLEKAHADADQPIDARAVLARATQASELVDDILASMDAVTEKNDRHSAESDEAIQPIPEMQGPNQLRLDSPQVFQSNDTKISIYRRARTGELTVTSSDNKTHSEKDSMPTATDADSQQSSLAVAKTTSKSALGRTTSAGQPGDSNTIRKVDNQQHEEALRHLLNHLRALKEKV